MQSKIEEGSAELKDDTREVTVSLFKKHPDDISIWVAKPGQPTLYRIDINITSGKFGFEKFEDKPKTPEFKGITKKQKGV